MFEIVHKACPSLLKSSTNDDVTPLCVAAMRNDKELFFRILDLGLGAKDESKMQRVGKKMIPAIAIHRIFGFRHLRSSGYGAFDHSRDSKYG